MRGVPMTTPHRRVHGALLALLAATLLTACEGVSLPFGETPAPSPTVRVLPTPPPTPSPTPRPVVEVELTQHASNEKAGPLFVSIAFRLRNPNATEWLFQAIGTGVLSTPDGRVLPLAKPSVAIDLGPGEQKWFAFPAVDTFGSLLGKVRIDIAGGQWLPAGSYPYPGGVPVTVAAAKDQRKNPPETADFVVTNRDELGINGAVRGFAFDSRNELLGLVECPSRLYPARRETLVACAATRAGVLEAVRLVFTAYPDLRPVLVIPTPKPTLGPGQTPPPATPSPSAAPSPAPSPSAAPSPADRSPSPAPTGAATPSPTRSR